MILAMLFLHLKENEKVRISPLDDTRKPNFLHYISDDMYQMTWHYDHNILVKKIKTFVKNIFTIFVLNHFTVHHFNLLECTNIFSEQFSVLIEWFQSVVGLIICLPNTNELTCMPQNWFSVVHSKDSSLTTRKAVYAQHCYQCHHAATDLI